MRALLDRVRGALADPNPILVRELRAAVRRKRFARTLYVASAFVAFVLLLVASGGARSEDAPATIGARIFDVFFTMTWAIFALVAPSFAAPAITAEREEKTFESLLLSGLSASRIFLGKLAAVSALFGVLLAALAPTVGIGFLFGGVSFAQVVVSFGYVALFTLAPLAMALAVSAHVRSSRTATALSTAAVVPLLIGTAVIVMTLERVVVGTAPSPGSGPFWFAAHVLRHPTDVRVLSTLVVAPFAFLAIAVGFAIASGTAALRSPAEDRSAGIKRWALFASAVTWAAVTLALATTASGADARAASAVIVGALTAFHLLIAVELCDEPPLEVRAQSVHGSPRPLRAWLRTAFGSGALPTWRFYALLVSATSLGIATTAAGVQRGLFPVSGVDASFDVMLVVVAASSAAIVTAYFTLALWLRLVLRSRVAAVLSTLAVLGSSVMLPLLAAAITSTDMTSADTLPNWLLPSPLTLPLAVGVLVDEPTNATAAVFVVPSAVVHGVLALVGYGLIRRRVGHARAQVVARRAARDART